MTDLSGIEQQRDFYAEAWDAERNRSAALQEQLDAAAARAEAAEQALQRVREVVDNLQAAQYAPAIVLALRAALDGTP